MEVVEIYHSYRIVVEVEMCKYKAHDDQLPHLQPSSILRMQQPILAKKWPFFGSSNLSTF